ncbi:MAG: hypothetical protein QOF19_3372 [Alphaproteobacteria bacterium]|jgi:hypothetical protein|nr:hypothetical protein [Alphaproteobacteria bacterium]
MTRRKGERTAKMNQRDYPYWVDIVIPERGLGQLSFTIVDWMCAKAAVHGRGLGPSDVARWCFADQTTADQFAEAFGGERRNRP